MSVAETELEGETDGDDAPRPGGERIAKVIARAGICSRRDAEKMILEGRVKLDGVLGEKLRRPQRDPLLGRGAGEIVLGQVGPIDGR